MLTGSKRPAQADLRRAISSAYYALFHCLARSNADVLIGKSQALRSNPAWNQTYRALEHGNAKAACKHRHVSNFPDDIQDFANKFVALQELRHSADYDPDARFQKSDAKQQLAEVEVLLVKYNSSDPKDRRAFAAWVLFKKR